MTNKIAISDNCQLAYDEYDFTPPWTDAEPLVLVHGFTKNRKFWFEWIPRVGKAFHVFCVDQRGHGDSDALPANFSMSIRAFSDDLAAFVGKLGLSSAHFVMAEFSSAIALDFAVAYPALIRSLTLPGLVFRPSPVIDWDGWAALVDAKGSEGWARATNDLRLPAGVDPAKKEWYVTQQGRFASKPLAHFFRFTKSVDLSGNLPKITAPTLLMTGSEAKVQSADEAREAAKAMPHAKLKIFDGMPLNIMSACPDLTIDETLAFLKEVGRAEPKPGATPR